jgi:hypothetical protein
LIFTFKHIFGGLSKGLLQFVLSQSIWKHGLVIKWEGRVLAVRLCETLSLIQILEWALGSSDTTLEGLGCCELHMLSCLFNFIQLILELLHVVHQFF